MRDLKGRNGQFPAMEQPEGAIFQRLSDDGKLVLRLIFDRHMEAGEVARELGVSVETVRKRCARARVVLGTSSTKEAARLLAMHEGRLDQPRVYPPLAVPPTAETGELASPTTAPTPQVWWRRANDLTLAQRHLVMAALFVILVIGFVLITSFLQGITSIWTAPSR